ncbi:hypothetical protein D9615_000509 [Tricholomella constricta]|uniref:Uncharacterized protein n=1 Tax=Tricholomella constricta TaxID=117010 RepID=A0A8H5MBV9_9AGAR|nr:hypothetical protein D9615_000509 [Tricholomella constricta]
MPPPPVPSSSKPQRGKRKSKFVTEKGAAERARKKHKAKGKRKAHDDEDEQSTSGNDDGDDDFNPAAPRRSRRATKAPARQVGDNDGPTTDAAEMSAGQAFDVDMNYQAVSRDSGAGHELDSLSNMEIDAMPEPENPPASTMALELDVEEDEKPKPVLQLKYQGFGIYGHCLCIVVEPWPPIRSMSRVSSVNPTRIREPSLAPPNFVPTSEQPSVRAKTPLFLPDDYAERSETPASFRGQSVPPAMSSLFDPRFLEDSDSEDDGGMMLFSQILNNAGDTRAGAANDDEDTDTGMFFGDADEMREL